MPSQLDVPLPLLTLAARQGGLVSAAQADQAGVGPGRRARLVRAGRWTRPTSSVLDTAPHARHPPDERRRRAAWLGLLAYGSEAIAVGACALALRGVAGLPVDLTPEVALPRGRYGRPRDGIRVRCFGSSAPPPVDRHGAGRVVSLAWALAQAVPELPVRHAVAVLDDVLHRNVLSADGLDDVRSLVARRRGAVGARAVWDLVDARAESPLESFARVDCVTAGIPPDELQLDVRSSGGRLLGRADLAWRLDGGRWLVAEVDGREVHEAPAALLHDRRRQNALLGTGWVDVLRFTAADLGPSGVMVRTVGRHLARSAVRPGPAAAPARATRSARARPTRS